MNEKSHGMKIHLLMPTYRHDMHHDHLALVAAHESHGGNI